jgi:hypothetical protein
MATNNLTSEMATAKIADIDKELSAVDAHLAHYAAHREALLAVKKALLPLAGKPTKKSPTTDATKQKVPNGSVASIATSTLTVQRPRRATSTGFRDAIRSALAENPRGLRPAEVYKVLESKGDLAKYTGKVPLPTRIHNELYALKKSKAVTRRSGKYALVPREPGPPSMTVN